MFNIIDIVFYKFCIYGVLNLIFVNLKECIDFFVKYGVKVYIIYYRSLDDIYVMIEFL